MGFIRAVREITELDAQIVASSSSEAEAQSFIICKNICPANERLLPAHGSRGSFFRTRATAFEGGLLHDLSTNRTTE